MNRLQDQLFAFEPATESQKILHAEALVRFNELVEKRRQRLDSARAGLPGVFWWLLLPGAMGCVVLCLFFHLDDTRYQRTLLLGLSGFLSMVLFIVIALDRPFHGDMAIGAESYELIYDHHMVSHSQ